MAYTTGARFFCRKVSQSVNCGLAVVALMYSMSSGCVVARSMRLRGGEEEDAAGWKVSWAHFHAKDRRSW